MRPRLAAVTIEGDPVLLRLLVRNVVENAVRHNVPNGHVDVELATDNGMAVLVVENSGPQVPAADLPTRGPPSTAPVLAPRGPAGTGWVWPLWTPSPSPTPES